MSTRVPKPWAAMRKEPRQARARATVEAIVQAGAHILSARGWSGFTTNEVADAAGASIGSLYQYFPNKFALVAAIRRKHFDDVLAVLQRAGENRTSSGQMVDDLVQGMIAVHCLNPALHRVQLDLPDPEGSNTTYADFQAEYLRRYGAVVAAWRRGQDGGADDLVAQVLSSAVEGVIHNAVRRGMLASPALKQELTTLVYRYLGPPATPPGL